ncbi:MAG: hypothetical protein ACRDYB_15330 [Acidimicrobiales bacterium]
MLRPSEHTTRHRVGLRLGEPDMPALLVSPGITRPDRIPAVREMLMSVDREENLRGAALP